MCLRFPELALLAALPCAAANLRVCADPNNLPFSNQHAEGFENRIADVIAKDLGWDVKYTWHAQRRGFIRNTIGAGQCDVVMGVPHRFDPVETTRPYYRSTYVFVSREDRRLLVDSLDDDTLRRLRIGVHIVGDDYANPPPVQALARRAIIHNVHGYTVYGDYRQPNPPARLIDAVASDDVDIAIAWGPFGGYFGSQQTVPLRVVPLSTDHDAGVPFAFDIAVGVRKGDTALRDRIDRALERRSAAINRILREYHVPLRSR